jgi:hypothetical protein
LVQSRFGDRKETIAKWGASTCKNTLDGFGSQDFSVLLAAADAQTPSPPAVTQFDGTYAFVSSTRVNETYAVPGSNRIGQWGRSARAERIRPPLTIANGQA